MSSDQCMLLPTRIFMEFYVTEVLRLQSTGRWSSLFIGTNREKRQSVNTSEGPVSKAKFQCVGMLLSPFVNLRELSVPYRRDHLPKITERVA